MKTFRKLLFIGGLFFLVKACLPSRMVYHNFATIEDYKIFPSRTIEKGSETFYFQKPDTARAPKSFAQNDSADTGSFDDLIKRDQTVAFLIIQNDTIHYEKYFQGYDSTSVVASFSMAKSVLSMLIGAAIEDGYIDSIEDSIGKYIPDLKHEELANTSIHSFLQMTSRLKFNESYANPFADAGPFYYGRNLRKRTKRLEIDQQADTTFDYKSGNTQVLGLLLDQVLPEGQTISGYLEEKIWKPAQMEYDATWSTDDNKKEPLERTFCCLNARAVDFAKLGRLYLNKGEFNGKQLVPKDWVEQSTKVDTTDGSDWNYQYQWWLPTKNGDFSAEGILGQYIYVNPEKNLIIVRLGKKHKTVDWEALILSIAEVY